MLTFASIAGGTASDTAGLAEYLSNSQTLQPEIDRSARYYMTGTELARGEPAVSDDRIRRFAEVVARGAMDEDRAFEVLAGHVIGDRPLTQPPAAGPGDSGIPTFGWMIATGLMEHGDAVAALVTGDRDRHGHEPGWDWKVVSDRVGPLLWDAAQDADLRERGARDASTAQLRQEFSGSVAWERAKLDGSLVVADLRKDMHPKVARGLGIDPSRPLTRDALASLLAGRRADGKKIAGKTYARERTITDRQTGEKKELTPIGSYDFCLSPDKSVSVAWALGAPAEQAALSQAHREAAQDAMGYVAARVGQARTGAGGTGGSEAGNIGWISFDHYTSRPTQEVVRNGATETVPVPVVGDPQLHTHHLVPNAVFCDSGRVGSLDTAQMQGFIKEAGALYQAHIATNLRRLGADVALDPDTGMARLTALPASVRQHFSRKSAIGEHAAREYAREQGLAWDSLSPERRAKLLKGATQGKITVTDDPAMNRRLSKDDKPAVEAWREQAEAIGYKHTSVIRQDVPPPEAPVQERSQDRIQRAYDAALPWMEAELNRRSVISEHDERTAALRGLIAEGIADATDIDLVSKLFRTEGVRQYGETTALIWAGDGDGRQRVSLTTALHASDERDFIRLAQAAAADRGGALGQAEIAQAVRASGLSFEDEHGRAQRAAIHRIGEGGRLGVFIAAAGAGKTTALQPLVTAWHARQWDVHGVALAWRQADDLTDAGIPQHRVKAASVFMEAVQSGQITLTLRSVLVVDEVSLLGTRQGLDLLRLQAQQGFRLVLLGDDKQCQSIEAGPIIDLARKALGTGQVPELLTTRRQESQRERAIAGLFREGKATEALAMKREDGTAELVPGGYREAVERVARLVGERLRANAGTAGYSLTVSASTNMDAHRLGVAIRAERRALGQVGADAVKVRAIGHGRDVYDMALAPGDRVRLFASTRADGARGSIGRNGSILTVLDADGAGMRVRNAKGREGRIAWKKLADEHGRVRLAYGEVMTTHTAQGSTATEHIYALPGGAKAVTGFSAYSSGTRHRRRSYLVLSEGAERGDVTRQRPLGPVPKIAADDLWNNVARHFGRQTVKDTALAFLGRAHGVQHGTVRSLQGGAIRQEARQRRGREPTTLHRTMQQARQARSMAPIAVTWRERTRLFERVRAIGAGVAKAVRQRIKHLQPAPSQVQGRSRGPRMRM